MSRKKLAVAGVLGPVVVVLAVLSMGQVAPPSFGDPLPGLSADELARFFAGKEAFEEEEDEDEGLGPVFNENSCAACHNVGATGGGSDRLETRFGFTTVNGVFDPLDGTGDSGLNKGGSLMQDQGIGLFNGFNFVPEVVPEQANTVAMRRTTPLFGLGLVEDVPDETLIALQGQTGGVANMVIDVPTGNLRVGRFGWKCQQATLFAFSGDAYLNEMGITTPMFPRENPPQGDVDSLRFDPFNPDFPPGDPRTNPDDADFDDLEAFTDFMTFLGPPPRGSITAQVQQGEALFKQIGCAVCHVPTLTTAHFGAIYPYSDFLLHNMGSLNDGIAQDDGHPQDGPRTDQMRTAPLWGLRLLTNLLHDGSANNIPQAILRHDGQGSDARDAFSSLKETQKNALMAFLKSL